MNTSTFAKDSDNSFDFLNLDLISPSPTQDKDLLDRLSFIPGLKEILMLRQVHALEHATVWILSESYSALTPQVSRQNINIDNQLHTGLSTESGFFLYGEVNISNLRRAVNLALQRLTSGEWDLAVHPRCGTNASVAMLLTAGLAVGMHLLLPRGPIEQLIGLGLATTTATELTPDVGAFFQRYITTAIPFNLGIENITQQYDAMGHKAYFVQVKWK
ncbi:hypothetical protein IQ247_12470 [Plectonema cf. radiosum LEGE 06105]|uniref:Uncharacterized protein n=1 Tax=Plectonema cf. radiosum LEGE 06105 TaxID=945769 RepID=A0A8J7K1Z2_9CYAN|nr:DUF6391 domain-containing protein [Plectonema radiosum]MBE9213472.1 hypothetical protein [Plectonema cf. radiosum LEGE 06105]